jgi:preprotein translocase subunit SecG
METILLVILIIIALALIGVVLMQRSEGGALGMGGGPGGLFSVRGSANLLTRVTAGLALVFMILSLVLAILSGNSERGRSVFDKSAPAEEKGSKPDSGAVPKAPEAKEPKAPEAKEEAPGKLLPVVPSEQPPDLSKPAGTRALEGAAESPKDRATGAAESGANRSDKPQPNSREGQ